MKIYLTILGFIWLTLIVVWLVGALVAKRTVSRNWSGELWWRAGIVVSIIVLVNFLWNTPYLSGVVHISTLNIIGVIVAALGVALAIWSRFYLGRNWGMPMTVKESPELVTSGPYAYLRNPIYTGMLLTLLGSALVDWWWAVVLVWSTAYFVYASRREEQLLSKEFPEAYLAYRARTWRLIPWVY